MSTTRLQTDGRFRYQRYNTPSPPIYEVWDGDELIFTSYWRSSAYRKYKQLIAHSSQDGESK